MTIAEFVKTSYAKRREHRVEEEKHKHPIDADLPLGLHIGAKIEINPTPNSKLKMKVPGKVHLVQAFSRAKLMGKDHFKILLHSEDEDKLSYLWILKDSEGLSIRWFVSLDTEYPDSREAWEFWLSDEDGYIGLPDFQDLEKQKYHRAWVPGLAKRIQPIGYIETVYLDRYDPEKQMVVRHDCMLYSRSVQGEIDTCNEYIFLSDVKEHDGESIAIDIGIDLDQSQIKVQY